MQNNQDTIQRGEDSTATTRALARFCHGCNICPFADQKPQSAFGKVMRWHRTWCPAWAAHSRVYGPKDLS